MNLTDCLPVSVAVAPAGAVTVESGTRCVAMSRFSERAARLAAAFGHGSTHVMRTDDDLMDLPASVRVELADALDVLDVNNG
jgi:hypothetical protein